MFLNKKKSKMLKIVWQNFYTPRFSLTIKISIKNKLCTFMPFEKINLIKLNNFARVALPSDTLIYCMSKWFYSPAGVKEIN